MCSPRLVERAGSLDSPETLRDHTLIHVDNAQLDEAWPDWETWLITAGVGGRGRTPRAALHPAQHGAPGGSRRGWGLRSAGACSRRTTCVPGRLVQPFDLSFPVNFAYHVICPESTVDRPRVVAFRDWILREARSGRAAS